MLSLVTNTDVMGTNAAVFVVMLKMACKAPTPGYALPRNSPVCTNAYVVMGTNTDVVTDENTDVVIVTHANGV